MRSIAYATLLMSFALGCGADNGSGNADSEHGQVKFAIGLAPAEAKCAQLTVRQGSTTTFRKFPLSPNQQSVFHIKDLPLGNIILSEEVFTVTCANTQNAQPKWYSDNVELELIAGMPVDVSFQLRLASTNGEVTVHTNFPTPASRFSEFNVPHSASGVIAGPDDNMWFMLGELLPSKVGRMSPTGTLTTFDLGGWVTSFVAGPDGNVWFARGDTPRIGRISPSGAITEFNSVPNRLLLQLTAGPDGAVWFAEFGAGKVGRIASNGSVSEFPLPNGVDASSLTSGPDGNLWLTEVSVAKIARLTPAGTVTEFPIASGVGQTIIAGPDGNLWMTILLPNNTRKFGKVTTAGVITEFAIPSAVSVPTSLAAGADGHIWFSDTTNNALGRMTPQGAIISVPGPNPTNSNLLGHPSMIAAGPDGKLWLTFSFTQTPFPKIGRFDPRGL